MGVSGISKPKKEEPSSPVLSQSTGKRIKQEEPDSPPPLPQRRLITSGSQRYSIIPPECRKAQPGFKKAREAWSRREAEALKILGLKPVRTFIREDGLVIDWTSVVPVWNDTLEHPVPGHPALGPPQNESLSQPRVKRAKLTPNNDSLAVSASKPSAESNLTTSKPAQTIESALLLSVMPPVSGQTTKEITGKKDRATDIVAPTSTQLESTDEDYVYFDADADAEGMYTGALEFLQRCTERGAKEFRVKARQSDHPRLVL
ncbi:hypothetical protein HWV62_2231 [Athelia sp. TMB]|nr:hypothetical protein HWV62_2231 [Athelia sp. TMB]